MNYNSDNSTTRTENSLVENLTKKNAQGIAEMRTDALPVMVPIQEKDWDMITMKFLKKILINLLIS